MKNKDVARCHFLYYCVRGDHVNGILCSLFRLDAETTINGCDPMALTIQHPDFETRVAVRETDRAAASAASMHSGREARTVSRPFPL